MSSFGEKIAMLTFKGTVGGMWITLDQDAQIDALLAEFTVALRQRAAFLATGSLLLDTGRRVLTPHLTSRILAIAQDFGLSVAHLGDSAALRPGSSSRASRRPLEPIPLPGPETRAVQILRGTLRSGQEIQYPGDLVVLGDVNAGAKASADGDIFILGVLRGVAHAGAGGDAARLIYAGTFAPTQVRIGSVMASNPGTIGRSKSPETARVEEGRIVVEPWPAEKIRPRTDKALSRKKRTPRGKRVSSV